VQAVAADDEETCPGGGREQDVERVAPHSELARRGRVTAQALGAVWATWGGRCSK
jgi:hypothetical protein